MPQPNHHRCSAAIYLLLASIYLLYLPHAEFVLDDWYVLGRYQIAREAGAAEQLRVFELILQNRFHGQFRFQWISFSLGYLLWLLVGYSPKVVFLVSVLLHAACAIALRRALLGLGIGTQPAFLAGAVFLLLPTTHGPLFWSFNCMFFLWCTFWFLLYVRSLAASVEAGKLEGKAAVRQSLFLLLALFSGDPIFGLLVAAAPLVAWFLRSRVALRATLLAWGTIAAAAAIYALLINKAPMFRSGVGLRYDFTPARLWSNLAIVAWVYRKLTGLGTGSYYELRATAPALLAAAIAVMAVVAYLLWTRRAARVSAPPGLRVPVSGGRRTLLLAAGLWLAAYGPILFLRGHEFRYDYVPSPYLALALSTAVLAWPMARLPLAGALVAWLAAASVAHIQQSWAPQSGRLRAAAERLRSLQAVQPGDLIIVSATTPWIGTAPDFAFLAGWASTPFAEHVTGVHGVEAACDIVDDGGKLRVYHRNYMRDLEPDEPARTRVLLERRDGPLGERRLLAQEIHPGAYRLYPLKSYTGPAVSEQPFSREQLALAEGEIYFAKPFAHHAHAR